MGLGNRLLPTSNGKGCVVCRLAKLKFRQRRQKIYGIESNKSQLKSGAMPGKGKIERRGCLTFLAQSGCGMVQVGQHEGQSQDREYIKVEGADGRTDGRKV